MHTLAEIEAAVDLLTHDEKHKLVSSLLARLRSEVMSAPQRHSVLDIPPVHVGQILQPSAIDDLLGEMLEGRP